jgi:hypothetical protein
MQIAEIFRCKVVDVSDSTLTLCVTGDPGKVNMGVDGTVCSLGDPGSLQHIRGLGFGDVAGALMLHLSSWVHGLNVQTLINDCVLPGRM